MDGETVTVGPDDRTEYVCVTGHAIPGDALDQRTEVVSLDQGAVLRQCKEHGAPVAMRVAPPRHD
jgi:hypothetical protein